MSHFLSFMGYIFSQLFNFLNSNKIASVIGVNVFVALVSFFVVWQVMNLFVFRGNILPGGLTSVLGSKDDDPEEETRTSHSLHYSDKNGNRRVRERITVRDRNGNSDSYIQDRSE